MIGNRLKEERERLGLAQPAFAEIAGAAKRTLIDWEKNTSSPTAVQLSALQKAGVDTHYVLTGVRHSIYQKITDDLNRARESMQALQALAEPQGVYAPEDERQLLELFRQSTKAGKDAIIATAKAVEKNKGEGN